MIVLPTINEDATLKEFFEKQLHLVKKLERFKNKVAAELLAANIRFKNRHTNCQFLFEKCAFFSFFQRCEGQL
jgi:hypothetical protein